MSDSSAFFENGGSSTASPAPKMIPPQNVEAEQALLGTILIQDKSLLKVVELLSLMIFIGMPISCSLKLWSVSLNVVNRMT